MKFLAFALLLTSSMSYASDICKTKKESHKGHYTLDCTLKTDVEESARNFRLDAYRSTYAWDGVLDTFSKSIVNYEGLYFEFFTGVSITVTAYKPTSQVFDGQRQFCSNPNANKDKTLLFSDRVLKIAFNDSKVGKKKHTSKWDYNGKVITLECSESDK